LSAFMKEGAEIYLKEVERINESKITRRKWYSKSIDNF
jgi:hypothetical protein